MSHDPIATALRVLDAIAAGEPWRITRADLDAAREALARMVKEAGK